MYTLEYSKHSIRALMRMPSNTADTIRAKLQELAQDPLAARNVKKLTEHPGYRLRVGDWRILYLLDNGKLIVYVVEIGSRGGIYK
ncbi:MAG: type II toxin-antitoxin system RelE/ParE family toxin [Gallionellaceae bacterium]|nr:type II toxin-antitoxin system RelE/ParE family toxin [Gallionellaceae bacterium]